MTFNSAVLIEPHFFPCVGYIQTILGFDTVYFNVDQTFIKQSYRNRSVIATSNGPLNLIIPLKGGTNHSLLKEIKVDHTIDWQRQHLKTIQLSYKNASNYLNVFPIIEEFYKGKCETEYLVDISIGSVELILELLKTSSTQTKYYQIDDLIVIDAIDLTNTFDPKPNRIKNLQHPLNDTYKPYNQVFEDKFGFQPNLSVLDYLFNNPI